MHPARRAGAALYHARMVARATAPARSAHGWLAAVIPASARRFRVLDDELRETLAEAGADLVDAEPDVEIGRAEELRGDAELAVVPLGRSPQGGDVKLVRALDRGRRRLGLALETQRTRRRVAPLYPRTEVLRFDLAHPLQLPHLRLGRRTSFAERLPRRALVLGFREERTSLFEAVVEEAGRALGTPLVLHTPLVREGVIVAATNGTMLKVAVGPARGELLMAAAMLDSLHEAGPPPAVSERVPWPVAHGRTGLADWLLERRLPGRSGSPAVDGALLEDCLEFLVELHRAGGAEPQAAPGDAELVARLGPPEHAETVLRLGRTVAERLSGFPRGFAHGDFWSGNLLTEGGRLTGVIDWDVAGQGFPALLDLLHLRLVAARRPSALNWGRAFVEWLLPWTEQGGDRVSAAYCERLGLEADSDQLLSVAAAYWLHRGAHQLGGYVERGRPAWIKTNFLLPLVELSRLLGS